MLRFKKDLKYIVWDTETESLNLFRSRPWQVSWLSCEREKTKNTFDLRLDLPDFSLSPDARRITRFNDNLHKRLAKPPKEVWAQFEKYLYHPDYYLVGHNILGFDVYQINNLRRMLGLKPDWSFLPRCIDTLCIAKAQHLGEDPPKDGKDISRLLWQYKFTDERCRGARLSLGALAKSYGIEVDKNQQHDALYDVGLNKDVFWEQVKSIEI